MKTLTGQLEQSVTNPSPEITCYEATNPNGMGLIIFPGGGYGHLAEHEGKGYAEYFATKGISCFVVTYRLGNQGHNHPAMIEDALSAIYTVRKNAKELGVDPNKIGIMGSSAGGHLTAHTMTDYGRVESSISVRPDFGVLCYPVIDMVGEYTHAGSRQNLLGEANTEDNWPDVSPNLLVDANTPPCFMWHTREDGGVPIENSMIFATSLRKHDIPFELHIFDKGQHGLGLNTSHPWADNLLSWLKALFADK